MIILYALTVSLFMGERDFFFFYDIFALFAEELCN